MKQIRQELEQLICQTTKETFDPTEIPPVLKNNLDKWHWGSYGWVSPASLIFTATWRKYFYPHQDCCKIWAMDEANHPIEGGYSIRSEDESITIPLLAKYDLCQGYCSPNSGMQGSRAIEKMRSLKRLNTDFDSTQRTIFDLKLFAAILNQINGLTAKQAYAVLQYQIVLAKAIRQKRIDTNAALQKDGNVLAAIEVKDKTQTIDWNHIDRAKLILTAHPSLQHFIFVLEKREATATEIIRDMLCSSQFQTAICQKITFLSIHDLYLLARSASGEAAIASKTGYYLSQALAVKPETKEAWLMEAAIQEANPPSKE